MSVLDRKSISLMLLLELTMNLSPVSATTDSHNYLHLQSFHPRHTKTSIIFSQVLRMRGICSKKSDLAANIRKLKDWFKEKGYPKIWSIRKQKRHWKVLH